MIDPINVWYSGGVMFSDYRLADGRIVTVENVDVNEEKK